MIMVIICKSISKIKLNLVKPWVLRINKAMTLPNKLKFEVLFLVEGRFSESFYLFNEIVYSYLRYDIWGMRFQKV
jgi:hypothetical protein